jgi:hypothetical protein
MSLQKACLVDSGGLHGFLNALTDHQYIQYCLLSLPLQVPQVLNMKLDSPALIVLPMPSAKNHE